MPDIIESENVTIRDVHVINYEHSSILDNKEKQQSNENETTAQILKILK